MEEKIKIHNSKRQFERSNELLMQDSSICEKNKEKLDEINRIEKEEGSENEELEMCAKSGRIFDETNNRHNMIELSRMLVKNEKFKDLWNDAKTKSNTKTAIHFLCLMLQMLPTEENLLYQILRDKL